MTELIIMDGNGIYVWTSFLLAFGFCVYLYITTKRELKRLEEKFTKELAKLSIERQKELSSKSKVFKTFINSQTKSI
tara:strand:+ start:513 stop:743 length:231 start_codon:yes stop_codon:yes gene_type:complete